MLTGSTTPQQGFDTHSGAGRVISPRLRGQLIDAYIQRAIDRDVPDQGLRVRKPESLRAWWTAYAAASSTTTSYTKILQRRVVPQPLPLKKLTAAPKHQIFDPGIAAAVLSLTPETLLSQDAGSWELFGQLFESLVTLTVRTAGQAAEAKVSHLRTQGGAQQVDLIAERYDGKVIAFEVKLKPTPTDRDVRHLHWLGERIGPRLVEKVVVTIGADAYRRPDGRSRRPASVTRLALRLPSGDLGLRRCDPHGCLALHAIEQRHVQPNENWMPK